MKKQSKKLPKPLFKPKECIVVTDIPKFKKPKQCILIGGGTSIKTGLSKRLWDKLKGRFVIGLNYSHLYYSNPTIQCYVDNDFYKNEINKLKKLPLIIGKCHQNLKNIKQFNTIMLQVNDSKYTRNLSEGIFKSSLCGLFGLSLAIYLLNFGEIYLLGYDQGVINNKKDIKNCHLTHFYQGKINHRGIGKINYYNTKGRADRDYGVFAEEQKIKIYNVSLDSRINTFPKISYNKFFSMLDNNTYDQIRLRQQIKTKLKCIK